MIFTETENQIVIPCSEKAEDRILNLIMEDSREESIDRQAKQFSVKYVSRLMSQIPKMKTPAEKVSALSAAGILFLIDPNLGNKVLNMIKR